MDITNKQAVGVSISTDLIVVLKPASTMTKDEALVHAAWLVALATPDIDDFLAIYEQIVST